MSLDERDRSRSCQDTSVLALRIHVHRLDGVCDLVAARTESVFGEDLGLLVVLM